jgi:DNA-binding response OmpR family regulator
VGGKPEVPIDRLVPDDAAGKSSKKTLDPQSRARFNLGRASVMLLDATTLGMDILVQIVTGLGVKSLHRCINIEEAKTVTERFELDLIIADAISPTGEGYDYVHWLRREASEPNRYCPVLLTSGHTLASEVARGRDCGAHFILKRPLTAMAVIERIIWVSREGRNFISCDAYVGPERRFQNLGPPSGRGRRKTDLSARVGEAAGPNVSQEIIDSVIRPTKVTL